MSYSVGVGLCLREQILLLCFHQSTTRMSESSVNPTGESAAGAARAADDDDDEPPRNRNLDVMKGEFASWVQSLSRDETQESPANLLASFCHSAMAKVPRGKECIKELRYQLPICGCFDPHCYSKTPRNTTMPYDEVTSETIIRCKKTEPIKCCLCHRTGFRLVETCSKLDACNAEGCDIVYCGQCRSSALEGMKLIKSTCLTGCRMGMILCENHHKARADAKQFADRKLFCNVRCRSRFEKEAKLWRWRCGYCGSTTNTRDETPLLFCCGGMDEPYSTYDKRRHNTHIVTMCNTCADRNIFAKIGRDGPIVLEKCVHEACYVQCSLRNCIGCIGYSKIKDMTPMSCVETDPIQSWTWVCKPCGETVATSAMEKGRALSYDFYTSQR